MIYSVMVNYEAPDDEEARAWRNAIQRALDELLAPMSVSDVALVAPLVQFDDEEEDS